MSSKTTATGVVLLGAALGMSEVHGQQANWPTAAKEASEQRCYREGDRLGKSWSTAERRLWLRSCAGIATDFGVQGAPDNKVSGSFVRDLLTRGPTPTEDRLIGIVGLHVRGTLDLGDAEIDRGVVIAESRIDGDLLMARVRAASVISFGGTSVGGAIRVTGSTFERSLILREVQTQHLEVQGSEISGALDLTRARVPELVEVDSSTIRGALMMDGARLGSVRVRAAFVGAQINLQESSVDIAVDLQEVETPRSVLLGDAHFGHLRIVGGRTGGVLSLDGSTVRGTVAISSFRIGRGLFMRRTTLAGTADIIATEVDGSLDLRGAHLTTLDLSETRVTGALRLASAGYESTWTRDTTPTLILHGTRVGSLQDFQSSWPERLRRELDGFSYDRFGGLQSDSTESAYLRPAGWFVAWLNHDSSYSPQPYLHLAAVLERAGQHRKAARVRAARRDRERTESSPTALVWWWLSFQKYAFGYGYGFGPLQLLVGLAAFTGIGTAIAASRKRRLEQPGKGSFADCFWYSLSAAVPGLQLHTTLRDAQWHGWVKHYFYTQRVVGYVIAVCVLAVLTKLVGGPE